MLDLRPHQVKARDQLRNGSILYGLVGTGKSRTAVAYYEKYESPKDVYVITTAKKRDSWDWEREFSAIACGTEHTAHGKLTVDSWNNIHKYIDIEGAFFIFDEQRLVGTGAWVKAFYKIVKRNTYINTEDTPADPVSGRGTSKNDWILLSGTPGDTWMDYAPVFIANGFFKNITEFRAKHVIMEPFSKFPKIKGYLNETKLEMMRNHVLVEMPYEKHTVRNINEWAVTHDKERFKQVAINRWNIYEDRPILDVAEMFRLMRRVVNEDPSRTIEVRKLQRIHKKIIVFYNFDYELEALRAMKNLRGAVPQAEWNGHKKQPIPDTDEWIYLVQYVAGAEGWNCTETDAMVFYSQTYSWKNFEQAQGRIDRLDTPFTNLYYYVLMSDSLIDRAIKRSLREKKTFNERKAARELFGTADVVELFPMRELPAAA